MRVMRPMQGAIRGLATCLAALWLVHQAAAGEAIEAVAAAKSDKLAVAPAKADLLNREPEPGGPDAAGAGRPETVPQPITAPAAEPAFMAGGTAARRLVDVALRDDGLWLNSFETRSMPLEALECAVLSDEIIERLSLPGGAVHHLAREELMRQTRLCAVNGSVLLTCYGGSATISLRRPGRGDGCGG